MERALRHLAGCGSCRARLRELETLRRVLGEEVALEPGFVDRVVSSLPAAVGGRAHSERAARLARGLVAVFAAVTTLFAAGFAATGSPAPEHGSAALGVAVVVALLTLGWDRVRAPAGAR